MTLTSIRPDVGLSNGREGSIDEPVEARFELGLRVVLGLILLHLPIQALAISLDREGRLHIPR